MSVLSRPQGTPERVWSVIAGLQALGGEATRDDFGALINPGFTRAGAMIKAEPTLANDTPGVAGALGLITREGSQVRLVDPDLLATPAAYANRVHAVLCQAEGTDPNRIILEAYAWLVAECARSRDLGWIFEVGQREFADRINAGLTGEDEDGRLMNSTKVTSWRRWLRFLGLGSAMPERTNDFPSPAGRLGVELALSGLTPGTVLPADEFLKLVAVRCPYLDRGRLYLQACERVGFLPPARLLSPLLSCGLRDLAADGVLALNLSGDAGDAVSLAGDPVAFEASFNSVVYRGGEEFQ